jgi:hypothetical protein
MKSLVLIGFIVVVYVATLALGADDKVKCIECGDLFFCFSFCSFM